VELAEKGMVIEQPAAGETIKGQWVAVSGWVEPNVVTAVLVVGAPVDARAARLPRGRTRASFPG